MKILDRLLGSRHERAARKLQPLVDEINAIAASLAARSEEELKGQTAKLRARIEEATADLATELERLRQTKRQTADSDERERLSAEIQKVEEELNETLQEVLDEILPEAFATVKEACRRLVGTEIVVTGQKLTWDMVPYDVQLIGAIALHQGKVAEMATGEGKTLVATMPLYLNALAGRGVHLVTVNSYLAQRDSEWMGTVYRYLGLTVDCIDLHEPNTPERRAAYRADITYGTNNEFGFDYLRDNMVHSLEQRVQRGHYYAIIDEVDSILIDEARTPLIISGPVAQELSDTYRRYNPMVASLYRKQTRIVGDLIAAAERDLEAGNEAEAGLKLLAARRGAPKNKRLLKLFADEPAYQRLVQQTEAAYMREKRLHEVDELVLFAMDEKGHNVHLSDKGLDELSPDDPSAFVVPDLSEAVGALERDESLSVDEKRARIEELEREYAEKSQRIHAVHQLLKAYTLFHRDEQYIVEDGQVIIVDEFTGRKMVGRRWSDGLHQAVEAKENVTVRGETQTLATITIQNYFRMYDKLAGMTGTAETEESEFHQIYGLDVMVIPTNRPVIREDRHDLVFRTKREKYNAIIDEIERLRKLELPVLVGTVSVDVSETLSRMLQRRGIPHSVLNAKYHKQEAEIVAGAGMAGAVTIATNMAGRGTDIKLGPGVIEARTIRWCRDRGIDLSTLVPADPTRDADLESKPDDYVVEAGGLHIIGSERHESRRIDRQLRGRAGRQGDPGASQFCLSLEDDLMRLFGSERIANVMQRLGAQEGEVITHPLVTRSIGRAQRRVELQNFEARKRLLDYDDVMNQQREVIYDLRLFALEGGEDLKGEIWEMVEHAIGDMVAEYVPGDGSPEEWDLPGLRNRLLLDLMVVVEELPKDEGTEHPFDSPEEVEEVVLRVVRDAFGRKLQMFGEHQERILSFVLLSVIDDKWRDHLYDLDHLKASIGFRSWGQKDPLIEYKKEAYDMFVDLMRDVRKTVASLVFRAQLAVPQPRPAPTRRLVLSGPSDSPDDAVAPRRVASPAAAPAPRGPEPAPAPVAGRAPAAAAPVVTGISPATRVDMSRVRTNQEDGAATAPRPATAESRVGRNDPCPCGSGRKYKKCHGAGS
ncbi:MAG TPA: preprotein translocase subunit SecA [Longimicrobiales bacterium]|nr:preprotein translocase subunit SecA [Longimicrobiales bacterium]